MCRNRGESQGTYITYASASSNKAEPTLALKPRGDITRSPKQGYQMATEGSRIHFMFLGPTPTRLLDQLLGLFRIVVFDNGKKRSMPT